MTIFLFFRRAQRQTAGIALLMLLFFVTACSSSKPVVEDIDVQVTFTDAKYIYAVGYGDSRDDAYQDAQNKLAENILLNIRSESSQYSSQKNTQQSSPIEAGEQVSEAFTSSMFSWSNVRLEQVETYWEETRGHGLQKEHQVTLRIHKDTRERLAQIALQKVPALNVIYHIERLPQYEAAQRLNWAYQGLEIAKRDGVLNQDFVTMQGDSATFLTYFEHTIQSNIQALKAIPVLSQNRKEVAFILIHEASATPQAHATARIEYPSKTGLFQRNTAAQTKMYRLDAQGQTAWMPLNQFNEHVSIQLPKYFVPQGDAPYKASTSQQKQQASSGYHELEHYRLSDITQAKQTDVYFYIQPHQANVRIDGRSLGNPIRHRLTSGTDYFVQVRSDHYREKSMTLKIPKGSAYAFVYVSLDEFQYGRLQLEAQGKNTGLTIQLDANEPFITQQNYQEDFADVGSYTVLSGRMKSKTEFDPSYQITQDFFELPKNKQVDREYPAPRYRHPYKHGWSLTWYPVRGGGKFADSYKVPYRQGMDVGHKNSYATLKQDVIGSAEWDKGSEGDFIVNYQHYFNFMNIAMQASTGMYKQQFHLPSNLASKPYGIDELELRSVMGSVGAGFWASFFDDMLVTSLTVNQAFESARWQNDGDVLLRLDNRQRGILPDKGRTSNNYQFAQLQANLSFGVGIGVSLSVIVPNEEREAMVQLGISLLSLESGYRRPAIVRHE